MSKLDVMFSNNSDDWVTPDDIYNHFINDLGCIDPCPLYSEFDNLNKVCVNSINSYFIERERVIEIE